VDSRYYGSTTPVPSRREILDNLLPYVARHLAAGGQLQHLSRHILGLFQGVPGARRWRRYLSEQANRPGAGLAVLQAAAAQLIE